jgi:hypothetical protein
MFVRGIRHIPLTNIPLTNPRVQGRDARPLLELEAFPEPDFDMPHPDFEQNAR